MLKKLKPVVKFLSAKGIFRLKNNVLIEISTKKI